MNNQIEIQKYLSAKKVLSTILLNQDTSTILDEYILSYLKLQPSIVTKLLDNEGVYHVYYRTADPGWEYIRYRSLHLVLIKSFANGSEARKWIIENGAQHVKRIGEAHHENGMLFIYHQTDDNILDDDEQLIYQDYLTFVFSVDACNLLLQECIQNAHYNNDISINDLEWVTYVNEKQT
jgi:hypothetical protein